MAADYFVMHRRVHVIDAPGAVPIDGKRRLAARVCVADKLKVGACWGQKC
jgi:hypothetical protein